MISAWLAAGIASLAMSPAAPPATDRFTRGWTADTTGEVRAVVRASFVPGDWSQSGREAVSLRLSVDGKYSQHILLSRGETEADYHVTLGTLGPGAHRLIVERDPVLSAKGAGPALIDVPTIDTLRRGTGDDYTAQAMAPILYAR